MIKKIRTESHTSMAFDNADKIGFSTETVNDYNIQNTLTDLKAFANDPVSKADLRVIPADASAEDLRTATYWLLGTPQTPEVKAALKAGTPVYHVVPTFTRIFEDTEGKQRTGRKRASIAGLGSRGDSVANNPLV